MTVKLKSLSTVRKPHEVLFPKTATQDHDFTLLIQEL